MSCKFGEIIKKLYSLWKWAKPSRHSKRPPPPPHELASCEGGFSTLVRENVLVGGAVATRHGDSPFGRGRAGWSADLYHSITYHQFCAQFNMKVDNDVLLLSYLDKICLILTGDLRRALASFYSGARLYKGPRTATRPQSTTLHLQATSLCERRKSATATHVEQ